MRMTNDELAHRFEYHAPTNPLVREAHEKIRAMELTMAIEFNDTLPPGRELALVFTKLEEAMFWANAAIARNHAFYDEPAKPAMTSEFPESTDD